VLKPLLVREEGWLLYSAALPACAPADGAGLLAPLPAGCKLAAGEGAALEVRAELPEFCESTERNAAIEAGFGTAAARLGLGAAPAQHAAVLPFDAPPDLAALAREVGWPFEERAGGSLTVDLGVAGAYVAALVEAHAAGVTVSAEIAFVPEADPCRGALVALLLRVNAAYRLVCAVLRGASARLEVELPAQPGAAELAEALAALAVAARACVLEARLLASDAALAHAFLERSGTSPLR
jgi:hypothetical protein